MVYLLYLIYHKTQLKYMDPIIKGTSTFKHFQRKSSASKFADFRQLHPPSFGLAVARFPPPPAAAGQRAWQAEERQGFRPSNGDVFFGILILVYEIYIYIYNWVVFHLLHTLNNQFFFLVVVEPTPFETY